MGINAQQLLSQDINMLRRELELRQRQQNNPSGTAAGAIGALLGSGIANVAQGRGFFQAPDMGLQRVSDVQRIMRSVQFDPANPSKYYNDVAAALSAQGYNDLAPLAAAEAAKFQTTKDSLFTKIDPSKFTPESLRTYAQTRNVGDLVSIEKTSSLKPSTDFLQIGQELGIGARGSIGDYSPEEAARINTEIQSRKESTQRAGVPQTPTGRALTPVTAKIRGEIQTDARNAQRTLPTVESMDRLLNTAFTGLGSNAKLTLGQLATTLGVDVKGVTETEQLNSLLAALTQGQARNLPGALSDKDVQFLKEAIGKGSFTTDTLRAVVRRIKLEALTSEIEDAAVQKVVNADGDLNKFDFVGNRKAAQARAQQQLKEQEDKQRRLQELRQKRGF